MSPRTEVSWVPVSPQALAELWAVYRTDVALQACRGIILSRLLGGGILFSDTARGHVPDAEFVARVQREFVPFARDVLDSVLVQGFAAFHVDARRGVPVCVPPGAVSLGVGLEPRLFRRRMGLFRDGCTDPDPRTMFVVDNWPSLSGAPASPVASFRRAHAFRGMVELNTAVADYSAARPLLYTTMDSTKAFDRRHIYRTWDNIAGGVATVNPAFSAGVDMAGGFSAGGAGRLGVSAVDMLAGMNETHVSSIRGDENAIRNAAQQQQMLAADLNAGRLDPRSVRLDPLSGLPVFDAALAQRREDAYNVVPLPVDSKVEAQVSPTSRSDLVGIMEHTMLCACLAMGIPLNVVGVHNKVATTSQDDEVMRATITRLGGVLTTCLADVYTALYGTRTGLQVELLSLCDAASTRALFEARVLSYDSYRRYLCASLHLSPIDLEKTDPRIAEDRREDERVARVPAAGGGSAPPAKKKPAADSKDDSGEKRKRTSSGGD